MVAAAEGVVVGVGEFDCNWEDVEEADVDVFDELDESEDVVDVEGVDDVVAVVCSSLNIELPSTIPFEIRTLKGSVVASCRRMSAALFSTGAAVMVGGL